MSKVSNMSKTAKGIKYLPPERSLKVPEGCLDAWQLVSVAPSERRRDVLATFLNFQKLLNVADNLAESLGFDPRSCSIDHKAVMRIGDKFHIIHFVPVSLIE